MKKLFSPRHCWVASLVISILFMAHFFNSQMSLDGDESAIASAKLQKLAAVPADFPFGVTQKIRGELTVSIKSLSEFEPNQPLIYVAEIQADAPITEADYEWVLPPGIELIQGQLKGQLENILPGEGKNIEVTLSSLLDENQQIHIHIRGRDSASRFTATAQYNTVDQEELDAKIKTLHEKTKKAFKKEVLQ